MFKCVILLSVAIAATLSSANALTDEEKVQQAFRLLKNVYRPPETPTTSDDCYVKKPPPSQTTGPAPGTFPKGKPCSFFQPANLQEANNIIKEMLAAPTFEDFINTCSKYRHLVNEQMFIYSYITALLTRNDTKSIPIPPLEQLNPYWFATALVIQRAIEDSDNVTCPERPVAVDYQYENLTDSEEACMAYFREDIQLNSNHYIWHMLYPSSQERDRRGELFYFLHQQILARYDANRFSCRLPPVVPYDNFKTPIPENYFPTLLANVTGGGYPGRPKNSVLVNIPEYGIYVESQQLVYTYLLWASQTRQVNLTNGTIYNLVEPEGINYFANLAESSSTSLNADHYGSLHNIIHLALARITTPEDGGGSGIVAYTALAMRDPIFYRWHKTITILCEIYKAGFAKYTDSELSLADVVIKRIFVKGLSPPNVLKTYTKERYTNISSGIAFNSEVPVYMRVLHLDHEPFVHSIEVENKLKTPKPVTVRIFIAPVQDHKKANIPFTEQRKMFICLDVFSYTLQPGVQTILRHSEDSSVTIPTPQGFDQLEKRRSNTPTNDSSKVSSRCLCGWPDSHLIPRGTPEGSLYDYYVTLTDGSDYQDPSSETCTSAPVLCGAWGSKYPDKKSMGYPFDHVIDSQSVEQFAKPYKNMKTAKIKIKHSNQVVRAGKGIF